MGKALGLVRILSLLLAATLFLAGAAAAQQKSSEPVLALVGGQLFDGDPLRSMESMRHIVHVIKDGKLFK